MSRVFHLLLCEVFINFSMIRENLSRSLAALLPNQHHPVSSTKQPTKIPIIRPLTFGIHQRSTLFAMPLLCSGGLLTIQCVISNKIKSLTYFYSLDVGYYVIIHTIDYKSPIFRSSSLCFGYQQVSSSFVSEMICFELIHAHGEVELGLLGSVKPKGDK